MCRVVAAFLVVFLTGLAVLWPGLHPAPRIQKWSTFGD